MQVITVHPDALTPYDKNPRRNDAAVKAVADSITRYGFRQPIVVDGDHIIVVGHTRWKAAKHLGLAQVPVHVAKDLTPEQARATASRTTSSTNWPSGTWTCCAPSFSTCKPLMWTSRRWAGAKRKCGPCSRPCRARA